MWLPKLPYPVRSGEHSQTAFALGLMLEYSRVAGNADCNEMFIAKARQFYLEDKSCPLAYEPSGEDFLSPSLAEADVMRRVLAPADFADWLRGFMPQIGEDGNADWLRPVASPDPSDGKLAHLDGLNVSRAWMLEGIASALPEDDKRWPAILAAAASHSRAGLAAVTGEHYEGGSLVGELCGVPRFAPWDSTGSTSTRDHRINECIACATRRFSGNAKLPALFATSENTQAERNIRAVPLLGDVLASAEIEAR